MADELIKVSILESAGAKEPEGAQQALKDMYSLRVL